MIYTFKDIKKILVIKLRHIGDVLLTVPVFRALRENFPYAHISALVNSGTEEVLTGNPLINEIIVFDRDIKNMNPARKYIKELSFLRMMRAGGFDMTVDLTSGDRAAIISLVSGARYRLAYDPGSDGFFGKRHLYTHLAKKDGSLHMVLQNLDVVRQFGISTEDLNLDFSIPEEAKIFVKEIFNENDIPITKEGQMGVKVVHVHPTSRWLFKCWKDEYMAEVIGWLIDQGVKVIVTSSPDEREMKKAKRILSLYSSLVPHPSSLVDLCGKTTIKQLAAISAASDLFLGVDSAPMHIATAVGTPVIALFGPTSEVQWGPWYKGNPYPSSNRMQTFGIHAVIKKDWECVPCGKDGCNGGKISSCMHNISPKEVIKFIKEKLKEL